MPWCPKCRNEYYKGFTVCADCGCELVDELPTEEEQSMEEPSIEEINEAELYMDEELQTEIEEAAQRAASYKPVKAYRNYQEKAADNKSSAVTLLGFGFVGLIVVILAALDIISFPINSSSKMMIYGVMGTMFVLFIVMGFVSARNAKKYAEEANAEDSLSAEIKKWCAANLSKEIIDKDLFGEEEQDLSDELMYFKRFEKMKQMISEHFMNLGDDYLDRFIDEYYQEIF